MATKDDPKEWTPDQPLDDKDQEEEANARAKAGARVDYLRGEHLKKVKAAPKGKDKFSVFS